MENEFPPNSHTKREARPERHVEKVPEKKELPARVTRSRVVLRKKPLWKKFLEAFRPEDNVGFVEYTILDVFVPSIKDAIADAGVGAIENALGTNSHGRRRRSGGGSGGYTSYNRMNGGSRGGRGRRERDRDDDDRGSRRRSRETSTYDQREAITDTRVEAEEILDNMYELISKYEVVTKRDLLSMLGEPHSFVDEDWGWYDLKGARIHKVRGSGYLIDLPRPEALDD